MTYDEPWAIVDNKQQQKQQKQHEKRGGTRGDHPMWLGPSHIGFGLATPRLLTSKPRCGGQGQLSSPIIIVILCMHYRSCTR